MKNILLIFLAATLFSCNSKPTEKLLNELEEKFSGFDDKQDGFYSKTVELKKGFGTADIKGIIDKNLNATPTRKHESWMFEGSLVDDYEWDLPEVSVKQESSFKDGRITHKIWIKNK
jgi:hypothetical protein